MRHVPIAFMLALLPPIGALAAAPASAPAPASSPAVPAATIPSPGKVAFDRWCAECHAAGVGHPGSQQLERLRGARLALLESRTDLEPAFIRYVVRNGQNAMPAYRPSEISDATLDHLTEYLGRKHIPAKSSRRP